jgi:predicted Rossmann fold nucleotide-binding protein DprA/Smf involved in DNA uptake
VREGATRVGIVGSRKWANRQAVEELIKHFPAGTVVVSGGARGVDTWAVSFAQECGLEAVVHLPELPSPSSPRWEFTKAYYARNRLIAENVDVLYAFVADDRKGGTENTIQHALKLGVRVEVICEGSASIPGGDAFVRGEADTEDWTNIDEE